MQYYLQYKNVIYHLKCNGYNRNTSYIGKTTNLHLQMNNHISANRHGKFNNIFDNHV